MRLVRLPSAAPTGPAASVTETETLAGRAVAAARQPCYTLSCGCCGREIATRAVWAGESCDAAYGHLMGIWYLHQAMSGHPGILAVLRAPCAAGEAAHVHAMAVA